MCFVHRGFCQRAEAAPRVRDVVLLPLLMLALGLLPLVGALVPLPSHVWDVIPEDDYRLEGGVGEFSGMWVGVNWFVRLGTYVQTAL